MASMEVGGFHLSFAHRTADTHIPPMRSAVHCEGQILDIVLCTGRSSRPVVLAARGVETNCLVALSDHFGTDESRLSVPLEVWVVEVAA